MFVTASRDKTVSSPRISQALQVPQSHLYQGSSLETARRKQAGFVGVDSHLEGGGSCDSCDLRALCAWETVSQECAPNIERQSSRY